MMDELNKEEKKPVCQGVRRWRLDVALFFRELAGFFDYKNPLLATWDLPADVRIIRIVSQELNFGGMYVELYLESKEFSKTPEGEMVPDIQVAFTRQTLNEIKIMLFRRARHDEWHRKQLNALIEAARAVDNATSFHKGQGLPENLLEIIRGPLREAILAATENEGE